VQIDHIDIHNSNCNKTRCFDERFQDQQRGDPGNGRDITVVAHVRFSQRTSYSQEKKKNRKNKFSSLPNHSGVSHWENDRIWHFLSRLCDHVADVVSIDKTMEFFS